MIFLEKMKFEFSATSYKEDIFRFYKMSNRVRVSIWMKKWRQRHRREQQRSSGTSRNVGLGSSGGVNPRTGLKCCGTTKKGWSCRRIHYLTKGRDGNYYCSSHVHQGGGAHWMVRRHRDIMHSRYQPLPVSRG